MRIFIALFFTFLLVGCDVSVSVFDEEKAWPSYVVVSPYAGSTTPVVDLNGNKVHTYPCPGFPAKVLTDGSVICNNLKLGRLSVPELRQVSKEGELLWSFRDWFRDSARQHHDYQVGGNPVGYYVPGMDLIGPAQGANMLILGHTEVSRQEQDINWRRLQDNVLYEIDPDGNVVWEWHASDHIEEMGFSESALAGIYSSTARDWLHMNTASYIGPNKWYDELGDQRFHPDNIMVGSARTNWIGIIEKSTGSIVWRMGPDFSEGNPGHEFGGFGFSHHAHIIPQGLPGAGNLLIFDNGRHAGHGDQFRPIRFNSRVLEINPIDYSVVWEMEESIQSLIMSSVQRLPNGNTFIAEGVSGIMLEVTSEKEVVWKANGPMLYRAYRIPKEWMDDEAEGSRD